MHARLQMTYGCYRTYNTTYILLARSVLALPYYIYSLSLMPLRLGSRGSRSSLNGNKNLPIKRKREKNLPIISEFGEKEEKKKNLSIDF